MTTGHAAEVRCRSIHGRALRESPPFLARRSADRQCDGLV